MAGQEAQFDAAHSRSERIPARPRPGSSVLVLSSLRASECTWLSLQVLRNMVRSFLAFPKLAAGGAGARDFRAPKKSLGR